MGTKCWLYVREIHFGNQCPEQETARLDRILMAWPVVVPPPMNDRNQCRRVKKYHWLSTAGLQFVLYLLVGLEKTATTPLGTRKSGPVRCRLSFKIQQNPGRGEKKGGGGSRNPPFIRRRNRGEPPTDLESVGQSENEYRWRHLPTE